MCIYLVYSVYIQAVDMSRVVVYCLGLFECLVFMADQFTLYVVSLAVVYIFASCVINAKVIVLYSASSQIKFIALDRNYTACRYMYI